MNDEDTMDHLIFNLEFQLILPLELLGDLTGCCTGNRGQLNNS